MPLKPCIGAHDRWKLFREQKITRYSARKWAQNMKMAGFGENRITIYRWSTLLEIVQSTKKGEL
jgi:hypothetical protein